ncbi:unnamed protein product [Rotaria magnacalcarata]
MPSSDEDLQNHVGRSLSDVRQELESCEVSTVCLGSHSTGRVPMRQLLTGESESKQPRRVVVVYDGDHPENKVTSIRQG